MRCADILRNLLTVFIIYIIMMPLYKKRRIMMYHTSARIRRVFAWLICTLLLWSALVPTFSVSGASDRFGQ